ncbi:MAG: prolyl oligopeptidase family serine peptidase, partial [Candidatus Hinthialibacter sp.]
MTLENLFHNEKLFGKEPKDLAWSHDGAMLAYRWNVYNATGYDVWLYEAESGKTRQLTNVEMFASFEAEAQKIAEANRKKQEGEDEEKEETQDEKQPGPSGEKIPDYSGVASFVWSETKTEMIVSYKNDLYWLDVKNDAIKRLTKTKEEERGFLFTKDGDGYIFWRGAAMIRVLFEDSFIEEIYPNIPEGRHADQLILSPDQKWLAIMASKSKNGNHSPRKVGYVSYKDRFAKWREHDRPLAEDPDPAQKEQWIYLQKVNDRIHSGTENAALEIFHHPGGDKKLQITTPDWSEDSDQIVFRSYDPQTEEIFIYTAKIDSTEKAKPIHHARNSGYVRSPNRIRPIFTPDGENVVAVFEDSGFRQPWMIDPIYQGKIPIVRGNFDALPIDYDEEGKVLFVLSNKEHPVRKDLYAVTMETGEMERITLKDGVYSDPVIADNGKRFAALFTNWDQPIELVVGEIPAQDEEILTDSHSSELAQLNQLKPQLFSYPNQHKQTVHGMVFLPPHLNQEDKPPIMIYTYGGPLGSDSMVKYGGFGTYNYRFPMYMAKRHGYIAAVIDPRGSSNYGALFENANWEQPGKPQVEDLAEGVEYLVEEYGGDPHRTALYGWSFGGFVTQMALYAKPEVFAVGMAGAGPTEWENYYGSYTLSTISDSQDNQPDQRKYSLLPLAKNLKGRLLLLHGVEDTI